MVKRSTLEQNLARVECYCKRGIIIPPPMIRKTDSETVREVKRMYQTAMVNGR